ncbi:MAG: hypothetical protein SWJ54_09465 [Cyanobacteriota bacterium]|nr:hypothetical protein [Cyanobacteriota bacterium]
MEVTINSHGFGMAILVWGGVNGRVQCQGQPMSKIAGRVGLQKQYQVVRLLQLKQLRQDIRNQSPFLVNFTSKDHAAIVHSENRTVIFLL